MYILRISFCGNAEPLRNREPTRNEPSEPNGLAAYKIEIGALRQ
jgi:hypothetical protein